MGDALLLALMVGAAYRLFRLLGVDDLPPLTRAREWLMGSVEQRWGGGWASGISCPWCLGFWCSAVVVVGVDVVIGLSLPLLWLGAVSTGVGIVSRLADV